MNTHDDNTPEDQLTPGDKKRQALIDGACDLFRELLGAHIDTACQDANESFQRDEDADAPEVKIGFTVSFQPLAESPDVTVKLAWSVKRSDEATVKIDPQQGKLPFADLTEDGAIVTVTANGKSVKFPARKAAGSV
jgi:hypothetical protein